MTNRLELNWKLDGFVDEQRYYCSETHIDLNNLPTPKTVLAGDLRTYTDTDVDVGKTYYVRVGSVKNSVEKISNEKSIFVGTPGHRYWRVLVNETVESLYLSIGEIFLVRNSNDLITSGKTYNQSSKSGAKGAEACFDGIINGSLYWYTRISNLPAWVSIDMGNPVLVDRIDIAMSTSAGVNESPKDFLIQRSNDGLVWETVKTVTGATGWTLGTRRQFFL
ncbi:putative tail protein [uncultured Caudovirales phage]|uniref:Putative tail protein n=1 Tax=uncultured Caudovirales phage TaxID=2100421 RepID=A0A2H4J503_9CAUD|nr:hypothetical protein 7AX4_42 [uncultured Caudovirales phage]ASN70345.1 putative tail protein [uncultured Caudovirales phage]ASN70404.1 putative tail protein [uncultured Caudovirales phage]